jgi:hypothetical protein
MGVVLIGGMSVPGIVEGTVLGGVIGEVAGIGVGGVMVGRGA